MKTFKGFVLMETMLAVMIFAGGVLALGKCVENCLAADRIKEEEARARRALENAMAIIESGAVKLGTPKTEKLEGIYAGMTLKTSQVPVKEKNEKKQDISGIWNVKLEVSWQSGQQAVSRELSFYYYPRTR